MNNLAANDPRNKWKAAFLQKQIDGIDKQLLTQHRGDIIAVQAGIAGLETEINELKKCLL